MLPSPLRQRYSMYRGQLAHKEISEMEVSSQPHSYRNNSPANSARFLRQTIHVCAPGVSMSVCCTPLVLSHSRNLRLISINPSSVPQAIHSRRSCWLAFASSDG